MKNLFSLLVHDKTENSLDWYHFGILDLEYELHHQCNKLITFDVCVNFDQGKV